MFFLCISLNKFFGLDLVVNVCGLIKFFLIYLDILIFFLWNFLLMR